MKRYICHGEPETPTRTVIFYYVELTSSDEEYHRELPNCTWNLVVIVIWLIRCGCCKADNWKVCFEKDSECTKRKLTSTAHFHIFFRGQLNTIGLLSNDFSPTLLYFSLKNSQYTNCSSQFFSYFLHYNPETLCNICLRRLLVSGCWARSWAGTPVLQPLVFRGEMWRTARSVAVFLLFLQLRIGLYL